MYFQIVSSPIFHPSKPPERGGFEVPFMEFRGFNGICSFHFLNLDHFKENLYICACDLKLF